MQAIQWDDLRFILALGRARSLGGAGRLLGVDPTTVGRRLRAAEQVLAARLFERAADGTLQPTEAGERALAHAESVEASVGGFIAAVAGTAMAAAGTVRLTAVPLLVSHVLAPASPGLAARHPGLRLELVAEPRDLSLTRREADVALRLARPDAGTGDRILARRVGHLAYGVYAAASIADAAALPWVTYEEGMARLPQARWVADAARARDAVAPVAFNDAAALMQAVEAGLGRALLPCLVADRQPGLRRLDEKRTLPARELWLLVHPELRHLPRVAAVCDWIDDTLRVSGAGSNYSIRP
ncbi:LysR family transcriptional regulator [Aliidongia dinghuensis]|uniref:LysR family transcriptional regulator n=1 Tax=Aliidongia dinghuensis TaxID=1867774 RepID=A0A8J2YP46_9PROT|nr:LysR family transcriptional regulator [Aliidongia dinghuensis]GGE99638.1 LysR family transcriptional regulator [Aliidongia dinghuensis]